MPDIFSSYADTAYEVEQVGALANLSEYLDKEELEKYVDFAVGKIRSVPSAAIQPSAM